MLVLAVTPFGALTACGSTGPSDRELAALDRISAAQNEIAATQAAQVAAVRRARIRAVAYANALKYRAAARRSQSPPRSLRLTPTNICAPHPRPATGQQLRAERLRQEKRRIALSYLNLRC